MLVAEHLGLALGELEQPVALQDVELPSPRVRRRRRSQRSAQATITRAPRARSGSPTRTSSTAFAVASRIHRTSSRPRARSPRSRRVLEWCEREGVAVIPFGGGTSSRRRHGAGCSVVVQRRDLTRPARARRRARGRRCLARGAGPGGRERSVARGAARRARADAAPLSAVVRVRDARRLDRDARGRSLRDRAHAHRGLRRVDARDHAARRVGVAQAAGLGRRRHPGPDARRLGGDARRDHGGLASRAAASAAQKLRRSSFF